MPSCRTILPIKVEADPTDAVNTAHAGLLAYLELWCAVGMPQHIDRVLRLHGQQGWLTRQLIQALLLLNLLGGESVTDIDRLEDDAGLCALARVAEVFGLNRQEKRELDCRFRGGRARTFPAATQLDTFLEQFHHAAGEAHAYCEDKNVLTSPCGPFPGVPDCRPTVGRPAGMALVIKTSSIPLTDG